MINFPNKDVEEFSNKFKEYLCGNEEFDIDKYNDQELKEIYKFLNEHEDELCKFFFGFWKNYFNLKTKIIEKHKTLKV